MLALAPLAPRTDPPLTFFKISELSKVNYKFLTGPAPITTTTTELSTTAAAEKDTDIIDCPASVDAVLLTKNHLFFFKDQVGN